MSALRGLIPPKIASARALAVKDEAVITAYWATLYSRLPKGPLPKAIMPPRTQPLRRWHFKHFSNGRESIVPWAQIMVGLIALGYFQHRVNHSRTHEIEAALKARGNELPYFYPDDE